VRADACTTLNLSEVELTLLFRSAPALDSEAGLRDRALLALLGLQGLRTVEIERANEWALLVRGKYHDRLVSLRADIADALNGYLEMRARVIADEQGRGSVPEALAGGRTRSHVSHPRRGRMAPPYPLVWVANARRADRAV
jgi:integrase/recombinase XerD